MPMKDPPHSGLSVRHGVRTPSRRAPRWLLAASLLAGLAACAMPPWPGDVIQGQPAVPPAAAQARIVDTGTALNCVVYARQVTGIDVRGDAWTWWDAATGRYAQSQQPAPGAILVFKRRGWSKGHLAVVTRVVDDRLVIASHANWLNDGRVHEHTPIQDVSQGGDWSAVRVWYTPGRVWGLRSYATHGFIHPDSRPTALRGR